MSINQICPSVDVVCWNETDLWIHCPYCEELHRHGFVSYESASRVPHCGLPRPSYQYNFPVAYEIDKAKARFINTHTIQYLEEDPENAVSLSGEFSNITQSSTSSRPRQSEFSFDDSTETITIPLPLKGEEPFKERRILFAISYCVCGNVHGMMRYLEKSSDKLIFLHGKDHDGDTCLIMASREKSSSMVSLLLEHGAEINATNKNGRTALMEASLWGRLETAKILLSRGADRSLSDNKNQRALDLAQSSRKNQKERHLTAGGIWGDPSMEPIHKEDVFNRDNDRREIARILGERKEYIRTDHQPQVSEAAYHSFRRSSDGLSITHCGPIREYPISKRSKTIAILERGKLFPAIAAMSGWGHSECPSTRVSGKDWTKRVLNIADIVGHTLSADSEKDQGIKGQFHASHAEKQLIAYFLDRHVFLPEDKIPDPRFDEKIAHLKREMEDMASQYPIIQQLYRLQEQKEKLEYELFDKDDRLLGEEYDKELVKCLKTQTARLSEIIASLERRSEVERIRARERQIQVCKHEKAVHGRLNRISNMAQKDTLRRAAILISAPKYEICTDCLLFKDNVNRIFGLSLELHECTQ